MKHVVQLIRLCIALTALALACTAEAAQAQTNTEPRCDGDTFHEVVCVWPMGTPGLTATNFVVREGDRPAQAVQVTEEKQSAAVVVVMQYGAGGVQQPAVLARELISALAPERYDAPLSIALVGVSGTVTMGDANNPALGLLDHDFIAHSNRFTLINNAIMTDAIRLDTPGMLRGQLYDDICKAMTLAAKRPEAARFLLVVGDGRDGTGDLASKTCTRESLLKRTDVPVFAIGIGLDQDAAFLNALALSTGGRYMSATGDPAQTAPQLALDLLGPPRAQYRISFMSSVFADGKADHTVELSLQGAGLPTNIYKPTFIASYPFEPDAPELTFVDYGGTGVYPINALPFSPALIITPTIKARDPLTVTLVISDGVRRRALPAVSPIGRWISTTEFTPDVLYALEVIIDARLANGQIQQTRFPIELRVEPFQGVTTPWEMPRQWLASLWAVIKRNGLQISGVLAGLLLVLAAARFVGWRVREMRYRFGGAGGLGSLPEGNTGDSRIERTERTRRGDDDNTRRLDDDVTRRFEADGASAMQTRVLAWLKFTDGPLNGQSFPIGIPGREILLGRGKELDAAAGHIRLKNDDQTISRQHARFKVVDGRVVVENLSESSTTRVNGKRIAIGETSEIQPNDLLYFADISALVTSVEE